MHANMPPLSRMHAESPATSPLLSLPPEVLQRVLRALKSRQQVTSTRLACSWLRDAFDACNTRLVLGGSARQEAAPPMPTDPLATASLRVRLLAVTRTSPCISSLAMQPHCTLLTLADVMHAGGAQLFGSLVKLVLRGRRDVVDLTPVAPCVALAHLDLASCCQLEALAPLAGLSSLRHLSLHGCRRVRDVTPLSALVRLQHLYLGDSRVSNLEPLAGCTALQHLSLVCCAQVHSLAPLSACRALRQLDLRGCPRTLAEKFPTDATCEVLA